MTVPAGPIGHWFLSLPVAYWLGFRWGYGAAGIWTGLLVGLTVVAVVLVRVWRHKTRP